MCWWKCSAKKQAGRRSHLAPLTPAHQPCRMVISLICVCLAAPFSCHFLPCLVNRRHLCTGCRGGKRQEAPAETSQAIRRAAQSGSRQADPHTVLRSRIASTAQQHSPAANVVKRLLKER